MPPLTKVHNPVKEIPAIHEVVITPGHPNDPCANPLVQQGELA